MRPYNTNPHAVRDADTDCMRLFAAFFVVLIHCSDTATLSGIVWNGLARFSVPVFVLISGYYLLPREQSIRALAKKSGLVLLTAVVWSAVYLVNEVLFQGSAYAPAEACSYLLTQPVHLWYLYALVGLYCFTPLLGIFHRNASQNQYLYVLGLFFFLGSPLLLLLRSGLFPVLEELVSRMKVPYTTAFLFLYLCGGYVRRFGVSARMRAILPLLGLFGTGATILGTFLLNGSEFLLSFFAPNVLAAGLGFFVLAKGRFQRLASPHLHSLAACMSGVYLLHPLVLSWLPMGLTFLPGSFQPPVRAVLVFAVSALLVFLFRKIPVLNRLFL